MICDRDTYIAVAGGSKKEYLNIKSVSELVEKIMEERNPVLESPNGQISFVDSNDEEVQSYTRSPDHCEW